MKRRSLFETVINLPAALIAVTGVLFALGLLLVLSFRPSCLPTRSLISSPSAPATVGRCG
jgi:hypothetical protein